ncbi:MAG TPA: DEAD/DEAH box helicase, partial [Archangium sp.]|nr:DEAD/DEAH box helicase [Archangium sp.]
SKLGRAFREPQESLLHALGLAARLFPPVGASLDQPAPEQLELDAATAWAFLGEGAPALAQAGFGIIVPGELTASGQRRLRLRLRVGGKSSVTAGAVSGTPGLEMEGLLSFRWEAALGGERLSARELAALARQKAPLVRHRGQWVAVDPRELAEIQRRLASGKGHLTGREALQAGLAGEARAGGLSVEVVAEGAFARVLERLRSGAGPELAPPRSLRAQLRPYQERGVAWLRMMASLGLGGCLADDMGLGKTVQLLAFLLARREQWPRDKRPTLLVAPTSVVGNWERERARFAPDLRMVRHYGPERAKAPAEVPRRPGTLVLTTYGLLRRDAALLSGVDWSTVVLDEAQNIKNAASATARAARALRAPHRFALTGTPVENRLAELWSLLEFANPGLRGPLAAFRRDYALPIERFGDEAAAARLRRLTAPFLLRRVKSDPAVIKDLPPKNEMKVFCTLTREQATLYQAVVDEELHRIEQSEGITRSGRVLALMMALKQICNHPAQYLGEPGPLVGRSGKLARVTEMLEEALAAGDKALVFTQFREMGDRLVEHLGTALGTEVLFLHGGTSQRARDELVRRFQEERPGPRLFVLSVKAGGTGINLTAASHVFHYDRWWNPAVEDQATDRAWRIGQRHAVQVHKLLCAGTLEEKVDQLLEHKRGLASRIVGTGEQWLTQLGNAELRELFSLSSDTALGVDEPDGEAAP